MAKLTDDEQKALEQLLAKQEAPDEAQAGGDHRVLDIHIDLGDEAQVKRAQRLGLLKLFEDEGGDEDEASDGEDEVEPDDPPRRRGYFPAK